LSPGQIKLAALLQDEQAKTEIIQRAADLSPGRAAIALIIEKLKQDTAQQTFRVEDKGGLSGLLNDFVALNELAFTPNFLKPGPPRKRRIPNNSLPPPSLFQSLDAATPQFEKMAKFFRSLASRGARATIDALVEAGRQSTFNRLKRQRAADLARGSALAESVLTPQERLAIRESEANRLFNRGAIGQETFGRLFRNIRDERVGLFAGGVSDKKVSGVRNVINSVLGPSRKGTLKTLQDSIRQLQSGGRRDVNEKILDKESEQVDKLTDIATKLENIQRLGLQLAFAGI